MTLRTPPRPIAVTLALGLLLGSMAGPAAAQSPAPAASAVAAAGLDGTWTIDHSIGSYDYAASDFSGSWAGYRAQEELVGVGGTTAVGRTPGIDGSITLAGNQVTAADLTVDLKTLASDESMRDGQLGRQGIQTDQFPTATFVLTAPIDLGTIPAEGTSINVTATGDLTLHGVTKSVQVPMAAVQGGDIIGVERLAHVHVGRVRDDPALVDEGGLAGQRRDHGVPGVLPPRHRHPCREPRGQPCRLTQPPGSAARVGGTGHCTVMVPDIPASRCPGMLHQYW